MVPIYFALLPFLLIFKYFMFTGTVNSEQWLSFSFEAFGRAKILSKIA